jgi:hypothetical protein
MIHNFFSSVFRPALRREFIAESPERTYATATTKKKIQLTVGDMLEFSTAKIVGSSTRIVPPYLQVEAGFLETPRMPPKSQRRMEFQDVQLMNQEQNLGAHQLRYLQ